MKPALWLFALAALTAYSPAQTVSPDQYNCLSWRCIGPFRGGRTVGIDGVWSRPNEFYIGVNDGGVWKTTDYGQTWKSVFDDEPTGSVGCLAIAQSNPDIVYVGSGEGLQRPDLSVGDGVFKTLDGGKHWTNMGLADGLQISGITVDPKNPDRVFVAVLGHPYGPNEQRGLFRTLDGGKSWSKVLYRDPNTGAVAVKFDPTNSKTVYAALWAARQAPWENGDWQGKTSGLFKSTDGGTTWKPLTNGLPTPAEGLGRIGFTICRANPKRLFATVDAEKNGGIYRSDDAGASWVHTNSDPRIWGRGDDFAEVCVDPARPDILYVANTSIYRSSDAGKTFDCIKGSPGGDDYHTIWIHPTSSNLIGLASDQGATISVNGAETWSSWYNQPTAQLYHVSTDNHFPYRVYGGQQESGSVGISSRGNDGAVTFRDWHPVGAEEYAYVAADPLDPDLIYGSKGTSFDWRNGSVQSVRPKLSGLRYLRTMPMLFSPANPHVLYLASNRLLKTTDAGKTWVPISPDLTRDKWDVPAGFSSVSDQGKSMRQRGVIYAVGPSPIDENVIWCGTDDGLVWVTKNGGADWSNVTPPEVGSWSKVSQIDAGHFDKGTAYVSVNRLRCDDLKPYIYRTTDYGQTWTAIVNGLPTRGPINVVREDTQNPSLLFCGSETHVSFSIDRGATWQSLRLNMPASSIRDLVIKDDDLVVGTHGRSIWIMDSINRLRDLSAILSKPSLAYLVTWNANTDTPLPPEEPAGKNPPDGVALDYFLPKDAKAVKLEIVGADGKVVRAFTNTDVPHAIPPDELTVDPRWQRAPQVLSANMGSHRFVYNLKLAGGAGRRGLGMAAIWNDTPADNGPFIQPGEYTVRLTVDGAIYQQPLTVRPDPRIPSKLAKERLGQGDPDAIHLGDKDEDEDEQVAKP
jgi:photosystem II stability/assembly factor-like uncharacterized protein